MRIATLLLIVIVFGAAVPPARAQNVAQDAPRVESAEVSGLSIDQLSPGLRRDIEDLAGAVQDDARIDRLARRIEEEHPDVVAATRAVPRTDGRVRIVYLVARINDDDDLVSNINSRYVVESVAIDGIPDGEISGALRDRLQDLVGKRLDHDEAERLRDALEAEQPDYQVRRRISRGSQRGRIRVVFELEEKDSPRWIPFRPSRSKFVYHSDQGGSSVLDIPMGNSRHRALLGFAIKNHDDLVEEYSGVRFGVESRRLATERVGARVEVSWLHNDWKEETLLAVAADPAIPRAYQDRLSIDPSVTVALTPFLRVSGGVSLSELEWLDDASISQTANAFVTGVGYGQEWGRSRTGRHRVDASYEFRTATATLESDLTYQRHVGRAGYRYDYRNSTLIADFQAGRLTGDAPLFERFTLGDTTTLRGWDKYDLRPAGGDRVFHQSLEYRIHHIGFFLDSGSVWNQGDDVRVRIGGGFGVHGDNGFITLAFPLNADDLSVKFMAGVRF